MPHRLDRWHALVAWHNHDFLRPRVSQDPGFVLRDGQLVFELLPFFQLRRRVLVHFGDILLHLPRFPRGVERKQQQRRDPSPSPHRPRRPFPPASLHCERTAAHAPPPPPPSATRAHAASPTAPPAARDTRAASPPAAPLPAPSHTPGIRSRNALPAPLVHSRRAHRGRMPRS